MRVWEREREVLERGREIDEVLERGREGGRREREEEYRDRECNVEKMRESKKEAEREAEATKKRSSKEEKKIIFKKYTFWIKWILQAINARKSERTSIFLSKPPSTTRLPFIRAP